MSKKAIILMTTYNGEEFLKDQLQSLHEQTFKNWDLYVSDNNSSDTTLQILKDFQQKDKRLKQILVNKKYKGAFNNYFYLLAYIKENISTHYSYFFYCDQDDIWEKNKMSIEVSLLDENNIPLLCYSNLELIDKNGKDLHLNMNDLVNIRLSNPYNLFFTYRYIWGTTMAHNQKLWDMLFVEKNDYNISHDNYIAKYAAAFGKIIYIDKKLVFYRRHSDNVSDLPVSDRIFINFKKVRVKKIVKKIKDSIDNQGKIYWEDLYFFKYCPQKSGILKNLEKGIKKGGIEGIKIKKACKVHIGDNLLKNYIVDLVLLGKFYKFTKSYRRKI